MRCHVSRLEQQGNRLGLYGTGLKAVQGCCGLPRLASGVVVTPQTPRSLFVQSLPLLTRPIHGPSQQPDQPLPAPGQPNGPAGEPIVGFGLLKALEVLLSIRARVGLTGQPRTTGGSPRPPACSDQESDLIDDPASECRCRHVSRALSRWRSTYRFVIYVSTSSGGTSSVTAVRTSTPPTMGPSAKFTKLDESPHSIREASSNGFSGLNL